MKERLQKLLAQANVASSRRDGETLIEQGRVRVNGQIATLGTKADPFTDVIEVDNRKLRIEAAEKIYIALNKPKHVLTTTEPHKTDDRRTVYDLVNSSEHLFSIGRLDADSEGLVVLTNDGDLAQKLTHPKYRHSKTYKVEVAGLPGQDVLDKWRNGIVLDEDERTAPCVVILLDGDKKISTLRIIMTEGKKRQIRRVGMKLGHQVKRLLRTHIGMLPLGELRPGEWRELDAHDIKLLSTPSPDLKLSKQPRRTKPADRHPSEARKARENAERGESESRPRRPSAGGARRSTRPQGDDDRPPRRSSLSRFRDEREGDEERPARRYPSRDERGGDDERPVRRSTSTSRPPRTERSGDDRPARPPKPADSSRSTSRDSDDAERPARPRRPSGSSRTSSGERSGGSGGSRPSRGSGKPASGRSSGRPGAPSRPRRSSDKKDRE